MKKFLVAMLLLVAGAIAVAHAGDQTQVYKQVNWGTLRAGIAVADSSTWDASYMVDVVPVLENRESRQSARVGLRFSNAAATCVVHAVRGTWDGHNFHPFDQVTFTATAPAAGTIRGMYVAPSTQVDMAGFTGLMVLVDAPSAGTVDIEGGCY